MNFRSFCEGVNRFETDSEPPNRGEIRFRALGDSANPPNILIIKWLTIVADSQLRFLKHERYGPRPSPSPTATCQSVLGVLQQLEDKMGAVSVALCEEHWTDTTNI